MIKLLGKNWILADFPLMLAQVGLGVLTLTIVLVHTNVASAQTRKSAASIPYSFSEQSNSFSTRPNPIRLVQAELEVPFQDQDDDPFALVDDFSWPGPGQNEWDDLDELVPQHQTRHLDFPESFLDTTEFDTELDTEFGIEEFFQEHDNQAIIPPGFLEDESEEFEIPPLRPTLSAPQQNTDPGRSSRPPFSIPENVSLDDVVGEEHPEMDAIRKWLEQQGELGPTDPILVPITPPPGHSQVPTPTLPTRPAVPVEPVEPPYPPLQPEIDEATPDTLNYGKPRTKSVKRYFQDCNIGQDMMFADQYGYGCPIEIAPFAGFFIENPYAPLFDFGGSGIDFFGYQRDCPPARPCGWLFDNMEVFAGTSGFGFRSDTIEETSFGLHEGINWSGSVSPRFGLAAQFGVRAVQRTVDGTNPLFAAGEREWSGNKSQVFITTGLFKRSQRHPFQYGVVYDWMSDNIYRNRKVGTKTLDTFNLGQVRTELSYKHRSGLTWGFRGAFGMTQFDLFPQETYRTRTTTQLHGFFEKPLWCGSLGGFSAGGTPKGNAILSAYYDQPLRDKFSLKAGFTYMLPQNGKRENQALPNDERNAWEAAITLTFHPHGGAFSKNCNPLRAMFDVAGNGSMIVSHRK